MDQVGSDCHRWPCRLSTGFKADAGHFEHSLSFQHRSTSYFAAVIDDTITVNGLSVFLHLIRFDNVV